MTIALVWTGKFNKAATASRFGASVFLTIDGDYAWVIWQKHRPKNPGRRPIGYAEPLACGRCQSEAEAMNAAAQWIGEN